MKRTAYQFHFVSRIYVDFRTELAAPITSPFFAIEAFTKKGDELASLSMRKSAYQMLRYINGTDIPVFRINENIWQVYLKKIFRYLRRIVKMHVK